VASKAAWITLCPFQVLCLSIRQLSSATFSFGSHPNMGETEMSLECSFCFYAQISDWLALEQVFKLIIGCLLHWRMVTEWSEIKTSIVSKFHAVKCNMWLYLNKIFFIFKNLFWYVEKYIKILWIKLLKDLWTRPLYFIFVNHGCGNFLLVTSLGRKLEVESRKKSTWIYRPREKYRSALKCVCVE